MERCSIQIRPREVCLHTNTRNVEKQSLITLHDVSQAFAKGLFFLLAQRESRYNKACQIQKEKEVYCEIHIGRLRQSALWNLRNNYTAFLSKNFPRFHGLLKNTYLI